MTINDAGKNLLNYFSPEERTIPDAVAYPGRNAAVMKAMNCAAQEMYGKGKPFVRHDERGAVLHAPTAVTIAVTNDSTAGTLTGWAAWMAGCTIVIEGADVDNQIRNASSTVKLKYPYSGSTGTKTATVYQDSIECASDVFEVNDPVRMDGVQLLPMPNPYAAKAVGSQDDFSFRPNGAVVSGRVGVTAGTPEFYYVDTWQAADATGPPTLRIRLFPAPSAAHFLEYPFMLCPPFVTDLAAVTVLPIPFNFAESIYLPLAVKDLRGCPFWRGIVGEDTVNDAAKTALGSLADADPHKSLGITLAPPF